MLNKNTISPAKIACTLLISVAIAGCSGETEKTAPAAPQDQAPSGRAQIESTPQPQEPAKGEALYQTYCLACHQANGGGVPGMQPALRGSAFLAGEKEALIRFLLTAEREDSSGDWLGVMASFDYLEDDQLADILTYARENFAEADAISSAEIAAVRATLTSE